MVHVPENGARKMESTRFMVPVSGACVMGIIGACLLC